MSRALNSQRFSIDADTEFRPIENEVNSHLRFYFSNDCSLSFGLNNGDVANAITVDETRQNRDYHIDFATGLLGHFTVHTDDDIDVELITSGKGYEIVT